MDLVEQLKYLKAATQALGISFEQQKPLFPEAIVVPEEIILTFYDNTVFFGELFETKHFTKDQFDTFNRLGEFCANLSDTHKDKFTEGALQTDPVWIEVRKLAKEALDKMGWEITVPDLTYFKITRPPSP
jgi:hypothetical protein